MDYKLNDEQNAVMEKYLRGEIEFYGTPEKDQILLGQVVDIAETLLQSLPEEETQDFKDDLIVWFAGRLKKPENIEKEGPENTVIQQLSIFN